MSAERALAALGQIKVTPVFTAHPTEAARRTVLLKRRRIAKYLERLDRLPLSDSDAAMFEDAITAEITALWQTDEVRVQRPQVTDEIRMGLDHYPMSIFASLPRVYAEMFEAFEQVFGVQTKPEQIPEVIFFGSWIGGDRDGNPFVTVESTHEALERRIWRPPRRASGPGAKPVTLEVPAGNTPVHGGRAKAPASNGTHGG